MVDSLDSSMAEETNGQQVGTFEPPRGKTNNVVSEHVRHKPACKATEAG